MEIFSLRPRDGQSLLIDLKRVRKEKKALDLFADGPIEILFCRLSDGAITLSIKAAQEFDIFLSGPHYDDNCDP